MSRVLNKKALAWIGSTPKTKNTAAELGRGLSAHDEQRKDSNNMSLARLEFVTVSPVKFSAATRWRYFFAPEQLRDQQMQQIARMFAPLQGMPEDPATVSAAGALAGLRA